MKSFSHDFKTLPYLNVAPNFSWERRAGSSGCLAARVSGFQQLFAVVAPSDGLDVPLEETECIFRRRGVYVRYMSAGKSILPMSFNTGGVLQLCASLNSA